MPRLSAGRVQSVATRLVVEREQERRRFVSASYWDLEGSFDPGSFRARLVQLDGKRVAQGRDFGPDGQLKSDAARLDEQDARSLAEGLRGSDFSVRSVDEKPYSRRPSPPFMTSTLQQEASRKLRFTAQTTMRVAQRLYERGYITYMRTDSTSLSEAALTAARTQATELFGAESVPPAPRLYDRRVKNAQEAHEAIRPAGDRFRAPTDVKGELDRDELGLYELIWRRTLASQMVDAKGRTVSIRTRRRLLRRPRRRVRRLRHRDHGPRVPRRLRGGARRGGRRGRRAHASGPAAGERRRVARARGAGPRDDAAGALHRGDAGEGARGAGHRPALDVRVDSGDDPRPRLRRQARHRARTDVPRLRRDEAARAALRPSRRLRLHRPHGGRPRPDRRRRRGARGVADAVLQGRRRRPRLAPARHRSPRRDRRAGCELDRDPEVGHRRPRRALRALSRARRAAGADPGRTGAGRADGGARGGAPRTAGRGTGARGTSRDRPRGRGAHRPLRPVRDRGAPRWGRREAAHRVAPLVDVPGDGDARRGRPAPVAPACRSARIRRTARRSWR